MLDTLLLDTAALFGILHIAGPVALHRTFRFAAHCRANLVSQQELPPEVAQRVFPLVPQLEALGFAFLGCYDFGEISVHTRTIVGYFCNRSTNDFAHATVSCA